MKIASIFCVDPITKVKEYEGEAVLISRMDTCGDKSFWEVKFLDDMSKTACRWVENNKIREKGDM